MGLIKPNRTPDNETKHEITIYATEQEVLDFISFQFARSLTGRYGSTGDKFISSIIDDLGDFLRERGVLE